jgi:hypothetical protein
MDYGGRCALTGLPEPRLIDAAHIIVWHRRHADHRNATTDSPAPGQPFDPFLVRRESKQNRSRNA